MANIGVVDNIRTVTLTDGATVTLPKVALATSWATLTISGANPGDTYSVTSGDGFVKLSINADGDARIRRITREGITLPHNRRRI